MINKVIKNISPIKIKNPVKVDLLSPWDNKKIAKIECIKKSDVNDILEVSNEFFTNKALYINKKDRIKILKKTANILKKRSSSFAGFGNVDENIVYKKLESLVRGAELASKVI